MAEIHVVVIQVKVWMLLLCVLGYNTLEKQGAGALSSLTHLPVYNTGNHGIYFHINKAPLFKLGCEFNLELGLSAIFPLLLVQNISFQPLLSLPGHYISLADLTWRSQNPRNVETIMAWIMVWRLLVMKGSDADNYMEHAANALIIADRYKLCRWAQSVFNSYEAPEKLPASCMTNETSHIWSLNCLLLKLHQNTGHDQNNPITRIKTLLKAAGSLMMRNAFSSMDFAIWKKERSILITTNIMILSGHFGFPSSWWRLRIMYQIQLLNFP